ncbi:MAG: hypothetical protein H8E21_00565 [Gammaproteobacteria bacterium]|nr:hypothetical protein [Gammaproteobacteria bacterium]MBL6998610.1 hypothetical protein [Gammaproteobacteria bacterium]
MTEQIHIRKRMVCLVPGDQQSTAQEACIALRGIQGVHDAQAISAHRLSLTYSLEYLSFELIEELLRELGYFLDDSMFSKVRRTMFQYLEDNVREKLHVDEEKQALVCDIDAELPHDEPEKYWNNYR